MSTFQLLFMKLGLTNTEHKIKNNNSLRSIITQL